MARFHRSFILTSLLAWALLAACGPQPEAATGPTAAPPTERPATEQPNPTTVAPTEPPATAPPVAEAPPTAAPPTAAPPTAAPAGPFGGIPQSRTPEGYQVLGNPDAPATLVMYSDFL